MDPRVSRKEGQEERSWGKETGETDDVIRNITFRDVLPGVENMEVGREFPGSYTNVLLPCP